jgi:hypothetical protein
MKRQGTCGDLVGREFKIDIEVYIPMYTVSLPPTVNIVVQV